MSWRRLGWIACVLASALCINDTAARAQAGEDIALRVTRDAQGCITEDALRARIASLHAQTERARGLAIVVDASGSPARLEVLRDGVVIATRRFDALPERCSDRLETLALVITLAIEHAIDPPREQAMEPEQGAPAEPSPPAPSSPMKDDPPAASDPIDDGPPGPETEPTVRTVVGMGGAYGLLPELAGVLSAGVELPGAGLRIGLGALVSSETSTSLAGGTALTRLAGARGYGCLGGGALALDLQACVGLALGVVMGSGRDYAGTEQATGTLLAPMLRLAARYPERGLFSVGAALEGFVPIVRPELQVSGRRGAVSALPGLGASLSIEVVLALP